MRLGKRDLTARAVDDPCSKVVRCIISLGAVLAGLAVSVDPTFAQQVSHKGWKGRLWAGVACRCVLTDNDTFEDPTFGTTETRVAGPAFTLGGDVEYFFGKRVGLDFALAYTSFDLSFEHSVGAGVQQDSLGVLPFLIALNFHVVNNDRLDIWLGPQLGYIFFLGDVAFDVPELGPYSIDTANTFSPGGFNVGADVGLSDDWALNASFRWQNADASPQILVDPTFITFGIARRF